MNRVCRAILSVILPALAMLIAAQRLTREQLEGMVSELNRVTSVKRESARVKATLCAIAAWISLSIAMSAAAQQPQDLTVAAQELRRAAVLLDETSEFFRKEVRNKTPPASPSERAAIFSKLRTAAEIFERFAPMSDREDLRASIELTFNGRRLALPATISEAVNKAETSDDRQLARLVEGSLASYVDGARNNVEAEIKFGPIVDVPTPYRTISPPRNALDLMRNLKFVWDHNSILRRDFYTPENLQRFFGQRATIHREPDGAIWADWVVKPTASVLAKMEPDAKNWVSCQYSVAVRMMESDKKRARLFISCNFEDALSPVLDDVERVFGRDWKDTWMPPMHGPARQRTSIDGNTRMTYELDKQSLKRSLEVSFE